MDAQDNQVSQSLHAVITYQCNLLGVSLGKAQTVYAHDNVMSNGSSELAYRRWLSDQFGGHVGRELGSADFPCPPCMTPTLVSYNLVESSSYKTPPAWYSGGAGV
jgi:hypothetical protein